MPVALRDERRPNEALIRTREVHEKSHDQERKNVRTTRA
jgi:hypothetical protein